MNMRVEIIAEIGQNHNGDIELAKELIHAAHQCGADVAKFQVYNARELFSEASNPWYEYNIKTELTRDHIYELAELCDKIGIEFMASVFDIERIKWLEDVNVKRYKIASRSIEDLVLIEKICDTGKPILVSLGLWGGNQFPIIPTSSRVDYLFCISKYPTSFEDLKLSKVDFTKYSGFSDHTIGIDAPLVAMSRGALIIEKHFTLNKGMYGPDHMGSMVPDELMKLSKFRNNLVEIL